MQWEIGASVRVKDGFIDEETGQDMSGWQGRVKEIFPNEETVMVAFDSVTLQAMPVSYIRQCEEEGYGWDEYGYEMVWLEAAEPRDTLSKVKAAVNARAGDVRYAHLGEEGRAIEAILNEVDPDDEMDEFDAWEAYLAGHLTFPFEAVVDEFQERGPLQSGDRVRVLGIEMVDDSYGVIVKLRHGRKVYHFPLCDLKMIGRASAQKDLVQLYAVWFANR
ncbi:MAG: hypothetical protein KDE31_36010 [Caldilineaceae bacterium]|nr:hypothetical protein [Caldilineaceae bacterium]